MHKLPRRMTEHYDLLQNVIMWNYTQICLQQH